MDPDACINRIRRALDGLDLDEVAYACEDLREWLGKGGFPPSNFERIVGFTETADLVETIARRIVAIEGGPGARAVRVDDRGDLQVYVWGCVTVDDAIETAEEYAAGRHWAFDEEDLAAFQVEPDDRRIVLARSVLANGIAAALQRAPWE